MKRPLKITIISVVVLAGVLVAADYGLAAAAEYQVSQRMRTQLHLASDPSVDIRGFPFMTQAIAGDYSDISIQAVGVPVKNLKDLEIDADLRHVHVSLSDLLSGNVSQLRVDELDGQVQVKATDIGRLLGLPDLQINPVSLDTVLGVGAQDAADEQAQREDPGSTNPLDSQAGVEMTATIDLAGLKTQVNAFGVISLSGGAVQITPKKLQLVNSEVSGQIPDSLLQTFSHQFGASLSSANLPLPFAVQATGVNVISNAILVQGKAENVQLSASGLSQ